MWYSEFKTAISVYTGLERDALHIHAALLLYILAMGLFRKSRRSRVPWLVVLALELLNEAMDASHNWGEERPGEIFAGSAKDLWNTMLWPTVLLFVGRYTSWFQRPRRVPPAAPSPDQSS